MISRLSQLSPTTFRDLQNLVSSEQAMFPLRFNLLAQDIYENSQPLRSIFYAMSRPKLPHQNKRLVQVNIRLTNSESEKINEFAATAGLSPANWIRYKIFAGKHPPARVSPLDVAVYRELKKIGVNLNQATHKLNLGEFPKEYPILQQELVPLLNTILKTLLDDRQHDQG